MNPLTSWHLKRFCEKHEIDVHEIDSTLTHAENKEHLETFIQRSLEDLAKQYGNTTDTMEEPKPKDAFHCIKKKWIPRPPKKGYITISQTHIEML